MLTDPEKERVRHHLGYPNVSQGASLGFGVPRQQPTLFLVEIAMNSLLPVAEARVRQYLKILDDIDTKLVESQDRLAATQLDELKLREGEPDLLEREYARWGLRLANVLAVPVYPYAERYRSAMAVTSGNIPVVRN